MPLSKNIRRFRYLFVYFLYCTNLEEGERTLEFIV